MDVCWEPPRLTDSQAAVVLVEGDEVEGGGGHLDKGFEPAFDSLVVRWTQSRLMCVVSFVSWEFADVVIVLDAERSSRGSLRELTGSWSGLRHVAEL